MRDIKTIEKLLPIETSEPGSFVSFEVGQEVVGFPYHSLSRWNWKESSSVGAESLLLQFGREQIEIQGIHLKKLLLLFQKQELFLVRVGKNSGPHDPEIRQILIHREEEEIL